LILTIKLFFCAISIKKADAIFVYSTPPTLGFMGVLLGKIKNIPVIYNLQDIFPDSLINARIIKDGYILKIGKLVEKYTYKNCNKIVVISEDFKRVIVNRGVPKEKIDIVYNWVDTDIVKPIPRKENSLLKKYNIDNEKFYITYCGNIGLTQNLELLIDVAKDLESYENIEFVVIGNGAHKQKLIQYSSERDIKNVKFLPFQPYEDISNVYSLGDVGLIISKKDIGNNSFPSKTWSIMSAERAVLASFDENSELCKIINNCNCGICVPPENKEALKNTILNLYNHKEYTKNIGCNGRKFILENLDRKDNTEKIYNVIRTLL
jgi:glycosyltransferase involved in cell wall biosynthesis